MTNEINKTNYDMFARYQNSKWEKRILTEFMDKQICPQCGEAGHRKIPAIWSFKDITCAFCYMFDEKWDEPQYKPRDGE